MQLAQEKSYISIRILENTPPPPPEEREISANVI